uniref:Beta-defensin n=1 Tax=Marmota marmota marmota TaxID=9994 RepID=A0A8C6EZT1_MARMA
MKSLLFTLAVSVLLTQLASGGWYVRKCANKTGNCRRTCRSGEVVTVPATGMCPKGKVCCLLFCPSTPQAHFPKNGSGRRGNVVACAFPVPVCLCLSPSAN